MAEQKFDFKKEYKKFYLPKQKPELVDVSKLSFLMVDGQGAPGGAAYQAAIEALYALSFTIKMSGRQLQGYFPYVVPPLESLWWAKGGRLAPATPQEDWRWTAMIGQPDFVDKSVFAWALELCREKKPDLDWEGLRFASFSEGLCVQLLHIGSYRDEERSMALIEAFIDDNDLVDQSGAVRKHHEIYLSDPRRTAADQLKTVLRCPVARE